MVSVSSLKLTQFFRSSNKLRLLLIQDYFTNAEIMGIAMTNQLPMKVTLYFRVGVGEDLVQGEVTGFDSIYKSVMLKIQAKIS